jgi:dimethylhistidine N-methyltransferase
MLNDFATDVQAGLWATPKYLSSQYFYDEIGSELFRQIMNLEEYYLTRCEFEILTKHQADIADIFQESATEFDLIEFGAGDGTKTKILLNALLQRKLDFRYMPIDISITALHHLETDLRRQLPNLQVEGICAAYEAGLLELAERSDRPKVVLFLGSNIGNFSEYAANSFLYAIRSYLNVGDKLLIGFDLKKEPEIILSAYHDRQNVTRDFNLNLLRRINRELGGDFNLNNFGHFPLYHPEIGAAMSYLVSRVPQKVHIKAIGETYTFEAWESIHTEVSYKYSPTQIAEMAENVGFHEIAQYYDSSKYFCDVLWEKE